MAVSSTEMQSITNLVSLAQWLRPDLYSEPDNAYKQQIRTWISSYVQGILSNVTASQDVEHNTDLRNQKEADIEEMRQQIQQYLSVNTQSDAIAPVGKAADPSAPNATS